GWGVRPSPQPSPTRGEGESVDTPRSPDRIVPWTPTGNSAILTGGARARSRIPSLVSVRGSHGRTLQSPGHQGPPRLLLGALHQLRGGQVRTAARPQLPGHGRGRGGAGREPIRV